MSITFPQINRNGTAPSELLEGYLTAKLAVQKAIEATQEICPNGRDYLPQGSPEATTRWRAAVEEHSDRLLRLRSVLIELDTLAEHVV